MSEIRLALLSLSGLKFENDPSIPWLTIYRPSKIKLDFTDSKITHCAAEILEKACAMEYYPQGAWTITFNWNNVLIIYKESFNSTSDGFIPRYSPSKLKKQITRSAL